MANIISLRTIIQSLLTTKCNNVYYEKAKSNTPFPYCVYSIHLIDGEVMKQGSLEINIVDDDQNTTDLETLAKDLWTLFDHYYYIDNDLALVFYCNDLSNVDVGEKTLHQRRLLITFKTC